MKTSWYASWNKYSGLSISIVTDVFLSCIYLKTSQGMSMQKIMHTFNLPNFIISIGRIIPTTKWQMVLCGIQVIINRNVAILQWGFIHLITTMLSNYINIIILEAYEGFVHGGESHSGDHGTSNSTTQVPHYVQKEKLVSTVLDALCLSKVSVLEKEFIFKIPSFICTSLSFGAWKMWCGRIISGSTWMLLHERSFGLIAFYPIHISVMYRRISGYIFFL